MAPKVFLTGVTGYIGGTVFDRVYKAHPDWEYSLLVRNEARAKPVKEKYPNVSFVYGGLDDASTIEKAAAEADIVIHTADSADNVPGAKSISKGLHAGHTTNNPSYWIHLSGAAILTWYDIVNNRPNQEPQPEEKYEDIKDIDRLLTLPDEAPHRVVDKIVQAANTDAVKTVIICPPTIYGNGSGPVNTNSVQVPSHAKAALQKGFSPIAGTAQWDSVHIDDLADLFLRVVEATQDPSKKDDPEIFGPHGYFFAENGSHKWSDVSKWVAEAAAELGYLPGPVETKPVGGEELKSLSRGEVMAFSQYNSRSVAVRAKKYLGWQAKISSFKDQVPVAVKAEAKKLGLTPKHK